MPSPYRIVVLGDSVTWGQGLLPHEKFSYLVQQVIPGSTLTVRAHSGATIGACAVTNAPPVDDEVPKAHPTVLEQVEAFTDDPGAVDLLVLTGGVNDLDVRFLLNPFTETDDLRDKIERYCFCDMRELLRRTSKKFNKSTARIVVTSYFLVLSKDSRFGRSPEFLLALGVPVAPFAALFADGGPLWRKILEHARVFYRDSSSALSRAIGAENADAGGRLRLAAPPFTDANAALASDPWLFGINWDLSPQDNLVRERRAACNRDELDPVRREQCYRASAGHPNVIGARKFADAILAALP
jgi:lysophospholipase L1-like esterase